MSFCSSLHCYVDIRECLSIKKGEPRGAYDITWLKILGDHLFYNLMLKLESVVVSVHVYLIFHFW